MKIITEENLKKINGGAITFGATLFLGGFITFLIGLIDGYTRPLACK